jgi:hypothetical protein
MVFPTSNGKRRLIEIDFLNPRTIMGPRIGEVIRAAFPSSPAMAAGRTREMRPA